MAQIENTETREVILLQAYHLFGRNIYVSNTYINNQDVSRSHATIHWSNGYWHLQDHSRNGTLVSGKFIRKTSVKLDKGRQLQFGGINSTVWKITDVAAPSSYLRSLTTKNKVLVLNTCHALPDDEKPEIVFYKSENKSWIAETAEKKILLTNTTRFRSNNEEWEFVENEALFDTLDYGQVLENTYFKFCISPNEEDIRLKLVTDSQEYDLGRRTYNYLLLTLTRKRLTDIDWGFTPDDQGWLSMEELEKDVSKELGYPVDAYYLNLQIYRLRKHLMEIEPFGHLFANVIERRTGEVRFAFPQIKVIKDNICIGEIVSSPEYADKPEQL